MADEGEFLVLGGKPIGDLRVTDLRKELERRGLSKSGNKKELVQRLTEALLEERGGQQQVEDGGGDIIERGRKKKAGQQQSSSRSGSSSGSSSSESRSRSRSKDDKSSSSSKSGSESRSGSASSRSSDSSRSVSPSPKKQDSQSQKKMANVVKPLKGVDNGTTEIPESQRSPLKMKIKMDLSSPLRSHVENISSPEVQTKDMKEKKIEIKVEAPPTPKPAPPATKPELETVEVKEEKQPEPNKEVEEMDAESSKDVEMPVLSPKRRISTSPERDRRIAVTSPMEEPKSADESPRDDRRIVQEKEADDSKDEGAKTTTDVIDIKVDAGDLEKKEEDVEEKPRVQRKRRWGGRKVSPKRQISISSESLKGLIPDVKPILSVDAPAAMEVVKEDTVSDHEKEEGEKDDDEDQGKDLKIRRTVTQVVSNEDRREVLAEEDHLRVQEDMDIGLQEIQEPKVKSPPQVVRKLTRKPLVTADEPQKARRSPSPPKCPTSRVIHIWNLVRPFTLRQLKELLERTGALTEGGFWIDKIKSHCLVMYETEMEASVTRQALHNTKWPLSNPKNLRVDFSTETELANYQDADKPIKREVPNEAVMRDRERERREREREREPLERNHREAPPIERRPSAREWDRAKIVQRSPSPRMRSKESRSRSREHKRRQKEGREKEKKERKEKKAQDDDEPPAKLLDDLFRKTKATPSIYWLPLTEPQALEGERRRQQGLVEKEKRRLETEEKIQAERKKREVERLDRRRKEQMMERDRERERERARKHTSRSRSRDRRRR